MHWELGKVTSAEILIEDHGCLTFTILFDFGGSGQCFGGIALDTWDAEKNRRVGTAGGADLLLRVMRLFGVEKWSQIKGRVAEVSRTNGLIDRVRMPRFEGGNELSLSDWRNEWIGDRR